MSLPRTDTTIEPRAVRGLRVLAICMCLTGLAFRQDPGFLTPDTKVDLTVDPWGLLMRSLHLWETSGNFGQVQNQAYGYLWPLGPFYALGDLVGAPAWVVQRLWWAVLLCVAFTGVVRLAGKMHLGTPNSRLLAGVAFALSVRVMTEVGGISIEAWPSAVAPWVLVPLVRLSQRENLRRPIALSALAVACAGGVNATAVFAVVPLAVLLLSQVRPVKRRMVALVGWAGAVVLATAWWILPLLLLAGYAPPFLNFIETAQVTTAVTDLQSVLSGTSHWQAYFSDLYGPVWPAGYDLATDKVMVWLSALVAALGLAGLARRGMPHRKLLITGLLVGVALVAMGHVAVVDGAFAQWQQSFLDGPGVALRNVHKFDVVLRIPLVLGLCHVVGLFGSAAAQDRSLPVRFRAWIAMGVGVAAVLGLAQPALAGDLAARGAYVNIPTYWWQAASWLDANLKGDRVLVLPGARFGDYRWGSTGDEVIQTVLKGRWGVRNTIPLTPPGTIRYLDAISSAVDSGNGSPGLADMLARAGVRYVLVRSDIDYGKSGSPAPVVVRQALARSPGLKPTVHFGPEIGKSSTGAFLDRGLAGPVPALEVFEVERRVQQVTAYEASAVTTVVGGPESLLALASSRRLTAAPTVLAGDAPPDFPIGAVTITDGLRRKEVNFGLGRDNTSATLKASEPLKGSGAAADYLPSWADKWMTVARYSGVDSFDATSSWSDAPGLAGSRPEHQPFAAFDSDLGTSWRAAPGVPPIGQRLSVRFDGPRTMRKVILTFDSGAENVPTQVTLFNGREQAQQEGFAPTMVFDLDWTFATAQLTIRVDKVVPHAGGRGAVGISDVAILDANNQLVTADRTLVVPGPPASTTPAAMLFSAAPSTAACFYLDGQPRCDASRARGSEDGARIDRTVTLTQAAQYSPTIWARPKPGAQLDAVLAVSKFHAVSASSTGGDDPASSAASVIDGNAATAWSPTSTDDHPWLRLSWGSEREVRGINLALSGDVAASRPWGVQVVGDGGLRTGVVDGTGTVVFDKPLVTDEITVFFLGSLSGYSRDPYTNTLELLPVAVGELRALPEDPRVPPDPATVLTLPCGSGPTVVIGDQVRQTKLIATRQELQELQEIQADTCGTDADRPLAVPASESQIVVKAGTLSEPVRMELWPRQAISGSGSEVNVLVQAWGSSHRELDMPVMPSPRVLVVRENTNVGWQATVDGQRLTPVTVDGWQQGWLLPSNVGGRVVLTFEPEPTFRLALLVGAGALGLVLLVGILPERGRNGGSRNDRRSPNVPGGRHWVLAFLSGLALLLVGGYAMVGLIAVSVAGYYFARYLTGRATLSDQVRLGRAANKLWLLAPVLFLFGTWLAEDLSDRHTNPWPQLAGLAALGLLWLSTLAPRARRVLPAKVDQRLL